MVSAILHSQEALQLGIEQKDAGALKVARARIVELLARIPHVTFIAAPDVVVTTLAFDERPVGPDSMSKRFSVDPGKHELLFCGTKAGAPLVLRFSVDVAENQLTTIAVTGGFTSVPTNVPRAAETAPVSSSLARERF